MLSQKQSNDILNYLFLLYAFSIPLSRAGVVLFTLLIFIFWLIEGDLKKKLHSIVNEKFFVAFLIYIGLLLFSLIWVESHNIGHGLEYMRKFLYTLPIFAIYTSIKQEYVDKVLYSFLIAMSISAVASIGMIGGLYEGKTAISFFISNHIIYSFFLSFSLLLFFILFMHSYQNRIKWLYAFGFMVFMVVLFFSASRTGQFLFFIGLFVLLLMMIRQKFKAIALFAFTSALIFLLAYNISERFQERIAYIGSDLGHITQGNICNSLGGRVFTWQVAYKVVQHDPILGLGVGDHTKYLKSAMEVDPAFKACDVLKDMIDYFHSQYIEVSSSIGLLGLVVFLTLFYFLFKVNVKCPKIAYIKIVLVVIFLAIFIVDVPLRKQLGLAFFALLGGVIMAQHKIETLHNASK
jgi:O-antigen ligase